MATKVISILSGFSGETLYIPYSENYQVAENMEVIFKDPEGFDEFGVVKSVGLEIANKDDVLFNSKILRKATPNDIQKFESFYQQSDHALRVCRQLVAKHGLEMAPFRAGYSLDGARLHFMFTADERVDFRELVKDLARQLQKKIYLRQIGPRDKAKMVGGFGKCGRELCCTTFKDRFDSINMEMVRAQGLEGKGSSKLSGTCGKLLCCLKYEVEAYKQLRKQLPRVGTRVKVKKIAEIDSTDGKVIGLDILNQRLKVLFDSHDIAVVDRVDVEKILK